MAGFLKTFAAIAVALLPGGFLVLFAYVATRLVRHRRKVALQSGGTDAGSFRAALSGLTVREVWLEAKSAF